MDDLKTPAILALSRFLILDPKYTRRLSDLFRLLAGTLTAPKNPMGREHYG
jgi:hypothetical protein